MNPEALVLMLEEHLSDLRMHMTGAGWQEFASAMRHTSRDLTAERKELERWTDRMMTLLVRFQYTKGLLQGFRLVADMNQRRLLPRPPASDGAPIPEQELVARITALVARTADLT